MHSSRNRRRSAAPARMRERSSGQKSTVVSTPESNLVDHYDKMEQLDIVSESLLSKDEKYLKEGERKAEDDPS